MEHTVVFSHANSFGASTYRRLFEALERLHFQVNAPEKFGHSPQYPVTNNWPHLVRQLTDYTQGVVERTGSPVWLVGHSLGGYLSIMAAASMPALAKGVVLLDSALIGGWKAQVVRAMKQSRLVGHVAPAKISRRRRNSWAGVEEVMAHFRSKQAFSQWDPEVLRDYATHGTVQQGEQRVLAFDRAVETAIYKSLPHHLERLLRQRPLQCPVGYIGGVDSQEMHTVGLDMTRRITHGRIVLLKGGHLFPMEDPQGCASALATMLQQMYANPSAPPGTATPN